MKRIIIPFFCALFFVTSANAQTAKATKSNTEATKSQITPQQVIDNYLKALGGKDKLEAVQTTITDNTLTVQGMDVSMVTKKKGNKFNSVQSIMGQQMTQIFDGNKGYTDQMGQKSAIPADKIPELQKSKTVDALSYNASNFNEVTTEKIDDKEYNVLTSDKGKYYFDAVTGLLYQSSAPQGSAIVKSYLTVDGIKFPEVIEAKGGDQTMIIKTNKVIINSGVTDDDFKLQ